jgi:hypothetical protein
VGINWELIIVVGGGIISFARTSLSLRDLIRDSMKLQEDMVIVMDKHGIDIDKIRADQELLARKVERHEAMLGGMAKLAVVLAVLLTLMACSPARPTPPIVVPQPPIGEIPEPPVTPPGLSNAGEASVGWLAVHGNHFYGEDGREWTWRGATDFMLLKRFCDNEQKGIPFDLDAHLTERIGHGFKLLRILGMAHYIEQFTPTDYDYWGCTDRFLDAVALRGMRVEFTVFADVQEFGWDTNRQREHFSGAVQTIARHWNTVGELCNECSKNGVDPRAFDRPSGVRTLWSRGSGLADEAPPGPYWDFAGWHGRRDWPKVLASNEDMVYVQWGISFGGPANQPVAMVADEPIGAAENEDPGRRTANCDLIATLAYSSRAYGRGMTYHSEDGLFSRPLGPRQAECADVFTESMK